MNVMRYLVFCVVVVLNVSVVWLIKSLWLDFCVELMRLLVNEVVRRSG